MGVSENSYALITGASKGLGKALAIELARRKFNVLLAALPNEGLSFLCKHIKDEYAVDAAFFETDLTKKEGLLKISQWVKDNYNVSILINNAGFGGTMPFDCTSIDYLDNMVNLNVKAPVLLTHQLLPILKNHECSYILNVSSMFSCSPIGYKTIYPATKSFLYYFSRGLAEELKENKVTVCVVHPGPMKTNVDVRKRISCHGFFGRLGLLRVEEVARIAISKMFRGKHVIVPGFVNYFNWLLLNVFPNSIKAPLLSKNVKREIHTEANT